MKQLLLVLLLLASCGATKEQPPADDSAIVGAATPEAESAENLVETPTGVVDKSNPNWKSSVPPPVMMTFEPGQEIIWKLETNVGDMTFKLFPEAAPMHVSSTVYLTELGFYDDVIFHRVIPGFMAQSGDPLGSGQGGPGYQYPGEFSSNLKHNKPGLLSMANRGPGTDGSQFFITFVPTPWLNGKHTIFGELVTGKETIKELEKRGSRSGATRERMVIERATIER